MATPLKCLSKAVKTILSLHSEPQGATNSKYYKRYQNARIYESHTFIRKKNEILNHKIRYNLIYLKNLNITLFFLIIYSVYVNLISLQFYTSYFNLLLSINNVYTLNLVIFLPIKNEQHIFNSNKHVMIAITLEWNTILNSQPSLFKHLKKFWFLKLLFYFFYSIFFIIYFCSL